MKRILLAATAALALSTTQAPAASEPLNALSTEAIAGGVGAVVFWNAMASTTALATAGTGVGIGIGAAVLLGMTPPGRAVMGAVGDGVCYAISPIGTPDACLPPTPAAATAPLPPKRQKK